jgi:hypothetical protein
VIGVVQRNDNVLMIVPTTEPLAAGWQWSKCTVFSSSLLFFLFSEKPKRQKRRRRLGNHLEKQEVAGEYGGQGRSP